MITKARATVMQLHHPILKVWSTTEIVGKWMENGRFVGYVLAFPGERKPRHLRFVEIRKLQENEAHEPA